MSLTWEWEPRCSIEEVGDAFDGQGADLADVGGVVEHAGSDGFVELKGLVDELEGGDQHTIKGSRFAAQIKWPR